MSKREVQKVLNQFGKSGKDTQSDQATRWLANNLGKIQTQMRSENFNREKPSIKRPGNIKEGCMLFFGYDPKTKATLQFWDAFPLIVLIDKGKDSLLGLNLHYLAPNVRASFLNQLLKFTDNPDYAKNPPSSFTIEYPELKAISSLGIFKAAIKRYIIKSIVTEINLIPSNEWKYTTFLPIDKFKGASREEVWKWSNRYSK